MRIIIPILITAIWTVATVRIEGVWPPMRAIESIVGLSERFEAPVRSLLATITDHQGPQGHSNAQPGPLFNDRAGEPSRLALSGLPKAPRRQACS